MPDACAGLMWAMGRHDVGVGCVLQGLAGPARGVGGPAPGMMMPRPQVRMGA